jgi:1,4-dihydroxy-6-naphthoate synthase
MHTPEEMSRRPLAKEPAPGILRFGHSPDPDDAFMFYGFAAGAVQVELPDRATGGVAPEDARLPRADGSALLGRHRRSWKVEHLLEDIQSLNERALAGELEMTAISAHAYPYVADHYWVMRTGVSMGDGYGPIVVARRPMTLSALRGAKIAVPGLMTTGMLALKVFLQEFRPIPVPFDQVLDVVRAGAADAGVVIHEGQLTYEQFGVHKIADLGDLWKAQNGLPLPLGLDVVRKDLGPDLALACSQALRRSIEYAEAHADEALAYAGQFGRGLDRDLMARFVKMYVNRWTLDMGEEGKRALSTLLDRAADEGLAPRVTELVVI